MESKYVAYTLMYILTLVNIKHPVVEEHFAYNHGISTICVLVADSLSSGKRNAF